MPSLVSQTGAEAVTTVTSTLTSPLTSAGVLTPKSANGVPNIPGAASIYRCGHVKSEQLFLDEEHFLLEC